MYSSTSEKRTASEQRTSCDPSIVIILCYLEASVQRVPCREAPLYNLSLVERLMFFLSVDPVTTFTMATTSILWTPPITTLQEGSTITKAR